MKKKKKKKRSPHVCYVEELRRWVTLPELMQFHEKVILEMKTGPKLEEVSLLTQAVADFFEDEGGFVTPVPTERGWYLGLVTFLVNEGFKKEKIVLEMLKGDFLHHIQMGWRIYHKKHPKAVSRIEEEYVRTGEYIGDKGVRQRNKVFNHHPTAVLRWMGTDHWDFEEARTAMKNMGIEVSDTTIRIQLRAGKKGERGEPAKLTEQEMKMLYECID